MSSENTKENPVTSANETTTPTPQQVLDLPLPNNDSGATTVRGYLIALLRDVWEYGEGFDGKRPFGNSSWEYDLYAPLVEAGMVSGQVDEYGSLRSFDEAAARQLIAGAIQALGEVSR